MSAGKRGEKITPCGTVGFGGFKISSSFLPGRPGLRNSQMSFLVFRQTCVNFIESHVEKNICQSNSYAYCTVNGDYYGAVEDTDGTIEIAKNDADTRGETWYYAVNGDMSAGSLLKSTGKDDLRKSVWYEAAMNAGALRPFQNEMAISAVYPIYGNYGTPEGVLTASLLLSDISNLATIVNGHCKRTRRLRRNRGKGLRIFDCEFQWRRQLYRFRRWKAGAEISGRP